MSTFQPPPTYALPVLVDEKSGRAQFNPIWLKWFVDLGGALSALGAGQGSSDHNRLGNLQGGTTNEYFHLTASDYYALTGRTYYPVGSIFISTDSANPATTMGYGTWEAFGSGQILIGA